MKAIKSFSAEKYSGPWTNLEKKHFLNRVLFGCTQEDLQSLENKTFEQSIEELIQPSPAPSPPLNHYQNQEPDTTGVAYGQTWINAPYGNGVINARRVASLRSWWIQQLLFQKRTIHEKLILFWHNHFATQMEIYEVAKFAFDYQNLLRTHAMGNFRDFVKAITLDPAMLEYLNGHRNTKEAPDENYARELQELFMLGKGENSKYTEHDVREAARVLTGHKYSRLDGKYSFDASRHDSGDKQFSDFFHNQTITGKAGEEGADETDELIEMILQQPEVSKFIVRKLYRFFIYYEITEAVEQDFIEPLAQLFREQNYEFLPLLKAFFSSQHFHDPAFHGAVIASPLDFVVKTFRHLKPEIPEETDVFLYYSVCNVFMYFAGITQQIIGDPPSVSGWPAYHQAPLYHQLWINSDTYQKRNQGILALLFNEVKSEGYKVKVDVIHLASKTTDPGEPNKLINELSNILLPITIDEAVKQKFKKDILLSGQSNDYYWTQLWDNFQNKPDDENLKNLVEQRLRMLMLYLTGLPEYQLI
ncbi:DUF1800 family protein [Jiulongibacter sediminis]|jgi:uncharacterized protein (DUF1800 family)|uniref:DUF1800 domain-containing protein n=1 Tax=Jiulongibacter sediminis TaxID=1605367 RepID=UPI0026F0EB3C|nr:DUF1800 domain-containing protein [Jiulongibacter sediminis]